MDDIILKAEYMEILKTENMKDTVCMIDSD